MEFFCGGSIMQLKSISLVKFLGLYLGITNEVLGEMTHNDIKILLPNLKRCSYDYAYDNSELVLKGEIIIVSDVKGIVVPYFKPSEEMKLEEITVFAEKVKEVDKHEVLNYTELNNYELRCLLNTSKNGYAVAKKAKEELKNRGVMPAKQKVKKRERKNYYLNNFEEE